MAMAMILFIIMLIVVARLTRGSQAHLTSVGTVLYCTVLYCAVLYTVLYTVLYRTIRYCTVQSRSKA